MIQGNTLTDLKWLYKMHQLPDMTKPFTQTADDKTSSVLLQGMETYKDQSHTKLDLVAVGHPIYLNAVAAAEKAIMASRGLVGYKNYTTTPYFVSLILL